MRAADEVGHGRAPRDGHDPIPGAVEGGGQPEPGGRVGQAEEGQDGGGEQDRHRGADLPRLQAGTEAHQHDAARHLHGADERHSRKNRRHVDAPAGQERDELEDEP